MVYIFHDYVVGRDAVSSYKEEGLRVYFVQVAHFTPRDEGEDILQIAGGHGFGHGRRGIYSGLLGVGMAN